MTILSPFPLRLEHLNAHDPKFKNQPIPTSNIHPQNRGAGAGAAEYVNGNGPGTGMGKGKGRRGKRRKIRWGSVAYQLSFSFFILLISVLLAGSGWGLSEQALRGGAERLNIFIVLAAYVFFFISSIAHIWSRVLSVKRILRTMPKPYVPTKAIDLPNKVANHIMIEYSRTAVVAHISQPVEGKQEGWGRPGTNWENQHLRTYILSTVPKLQKAMLPNLPPRGPRLPIREIRNILSGDEYASRLFQRYVELVDIARYARTEPTEDDADDVEYVVRELTALTELWRAKRKADGLGRQESGPTNKPSLAVSSPT